MMKAKYFAIAGVIALSIFAAGCGTNSGEVMETTDQVTVAPPTETPTPTATPKPTETPTPTPTPVPEDKNVIGTKTDTAQRVAITNNTGAPVTAIYVRPTIEESDEWGTDLVNGAFTLAAGDESDYYIEKDAKDEAGNKIATYDIRIDFAEEAGRNENYFRNLPLATISKLSLTTQDFEGSTVPYAVYTIGDSTQEVSTLNAAKERMGIAADTPADIPETPSAGNAEAADSPEPSYSQSSSSGVEFVEEDGVNYYSGGASGDLEGYVGGGIGSFQSAYGLPVNCYDESANGGGIFYDYGDFTVETQFDYDGNEYIANITYN